MTRQSPLSQQCYYSQLFHIRQRISGKYRGHCVGYLQLGEVDGFLHFLYCVVCTIRRHDCVNVSEKVTDVLNGDLAV